MVELPSSERGPLAKIGRRVAVALGLIGFVAVLAYLGRDGYADAADDEVTLLDAFYYASVSVTTTGYGDVRPESPTARLLTTVLVTPARVVFLILLVGTTLEVLAESTRRAIRVGRWRRGLKDHVIICGFGTKGHSAVRSLLGREVPPEQIVIIDGDRGAREHAQSEGFATVAGDASRSETLELAGIRTARAVVVAPDRDDAAVLITLTARELNPTATIVSAVREEENAHLLRQSGANSVIISSGAAGRLLGLATETPRVVDVLEDLLAVGEGLDIMEREVTPEEVGPLANLSAAAPVVAVHRGGELLRFDDKRAQQLESGDRIVYLCARE